MPKPNQKTKPDEHHAEEAAVLAVIKRPTWRGKAHHARTVAEAAKLTTTRAVAALKRLRAMGLVESDAPEPICPNTPGRVFVMWRLASQNRETVNRNNPVVPSAMPNGSQAYWQGFMREMNTPARKELQP